MRLSDNFLLHEFVRSQTAARYDIDNTPPAGAVANLRRLCADVLEPGRDACGGRPWFISSGYRCPQLNRAIGGAEHSKHQLGRAADVQVVRMGILDVARALVEMGVLFDKLIIEYPERGGWLHLEVASHGSKPRRRLVLKRFAEPYRVIQSVSEAE